MTVFRHRVTGPGSAGDIWVCTMHSSSANTLASVHTAWTTLINTFHTGTMNALWPTSHSATETITDQLDPLTGKNVAQTSSTISQVGTGAGGTPSPRASVVLGLRTALPTRSGRGRMYYPSPDDSHYASTGLLVAADAATISNGFGAALTTFKATSTPVIFHRKTLTFDVVLTVTVGVITGSQRRRTNKDNPNYQSHTI